jgi:MFS family permease
VGFALASSGDGLGFGAVPLLAVAVNPHPLAVSAVVAADNLPWLLVALPAGAFADHFNRGPLNAFANALRAFVILMGAILVLTGRMKLWLLILIVLANAAGRAIYYSSVQAMVPELVESEGLEHANGVLSGTEAGTEHFAGPIAGSSLFAVGKAIPFFTEALMFALSCVPFVKFGSRPQRSDDSPTSIWEGVRLLFADHRLRILVILVASLAGLQGMENGVLVLLATTVWGVRTAAFGLFVAVIALGNLLGSLAADRLVNRFGGAPTLLGTAVISGVGYLIMASADSWHVAAPAAVMMGVAVAAGSVVAISLRQRLTPPDLMGRVGAAWRGVVWGAVPVGAIAAGAIASVGGVRLPLVLAGALQILVALVLARPLFKSVRDGLGSGVHNRGGTDDRHDRTSMVADDGTAGTSA